jgi:hypothetical protein
LRVHSSFPQPPEGDSLTGLPPVPVPVPLPIFGRSSPNPIPSPGWLVPQENFSWF